jgi:hypothetical protein
MDFPIYYQAQRVTIEQLRTKSTFANSHPEMRRRLEAMLVASGGSVGIGTAWRSPASQDAERARRLATHTGAQMAPSDKSWHCAGGAADLVGDLGWASIHCGEFGLVMATWGGERWHFQPVELPHARPSGAPVDRYIGHHEVPANVLPPVLVEPPVGWPPFDANRQWWSLWPLSQSKPSLDVGDHGDAVRYLQGVLKFKAGQNIGNIDGVFGPRVRTAVRNYQTFWKHGGVAITVDGKVGMQETWPLIDWSAVH